MLELSDITNEQEHDNNESNGNHVKQPKENNRRDVSTSKKPKQDDKEMIDVEGNKLGAHEDEMQQQNILCKILLNLKPKLAKEKQKKKEPANNTSDANNPVENCMGNLSFCSYKRVGRRGEVGVSERVGVWKGKWNVQRVRWDEMR